jgi:hypothetical protein
VVEKKHRVVDEDRQREWFTIIPNVVLEMELNPYELALYVLYKRIAGENGVCWASTRTLAKRLDCGVATVARARTVLAERGLIRREIRAVDSGQPVDHVVIVDIWSENAQKMLADRSREERSKRKRSRGEHQRSTQEQGSSREERKKNLLRRDTEEKNEPNGASKSSPGLQSLVEQYIAKCGYWNGKKPTRQEWGRMARGLKELLESDYSQEQILGCLEWMLSWKKGMV